MCLALRKLQGEWVLAFGALTMESYEKQSISFEAGRVVRIRKQPFKVWFGTR